MTTRKNEAEDNFISEDSKAPPACEKDTVIYLTADLDNELEKVECIVQV